MRASHWLRQAATGLVVLFLASCGGNGGDNTGDSLTSIVRIASSVPASAVVTLDASASSTSSGNPLVYTWVLTSKPAGSVATISDTTSDAPTLNTDVVGTYNVMLTLSDGKKILTSTGSVTATAFTPPTVIADIVEPVSGTVQLSVAGDPGSSSIGWTVDGVTLATGATVPWDTTTVANGSHLVDARLQFAANYYIDVTRTFQVAQSTVSFVSPAVSESAGQFTAIVGAQSANGIVRVAATIDGAPLGSLAVPNACLDPTGAACVAALNGYSFGGTVGSGQHVVIVTATDGIGNSLGIQLRLTVTDVP